MQYCHWLCTGVAFIVVLACASWQARAAVISIDFGGEWIKVALVKVREALSDTDRQTMHIIWRSRSKLDICNNQRLIIYYSIITPLIPCLVIYFTAWCSYGNCPQQVRFSTISRVLQSTMIMCPLSRFT